MVYLQWTPSGSYGFVVSGSDKCQAGQKTDKTHDETQTDWRAVPEGRAGPQSGTLTHASVNTLPTIL